MKEIDLYPPMCDWLQQHLSDKYKNCDIVVADTHSERLDRALQRCGVIYDIATGIDIQIDVLGIIKNNRGVKLFFVEAKKTSLTLRDVGQLWAYCKLINPEEAFLFTSADLGSLNKLLNVYNREDLLDFGDGKTIKKMKIGIWDLKTNAPESGSIYPKI
ncbi:MAG: hypothetical protein LBJ14_07395 [Desulfarculales bacterium]|jgi:hypothetical protein|nr:hypothetical protein [Desulfarculales bacterium]